MKITLGLDIGVASIGWALVKHEKDQKDIVATGVRIIPMDKGTKDEFTLAAEKNQARTTLRGARRRNNRFKMRRNSLTSALKKLGIEVDEKYYKLYPLDLYALRAKAVSEKVSLVELGRIFLWMNKKRGFKSNRKDKSAEKEVSDYKKRIEDNVTGLNGRTIGQYFYDVMKDAMPEGSDAQKKAVVTIRVKGRIFTRAEYVSEFNQIWDEQAKHHNVLTKELKLRLRDEIIYFQRPLKSQKHLVGGCEFCYSMIRHPKTGEMVKKPYKVAPISSPIFQEFRIEQTLSTFEFKNSKTREKRGLTLEERPKVAALFHSKEKVEPSDIIKAIKLDPDFTSLNYTRAIPGNQTKYAIRKSLKSAGIKDLESYLDYAIFEKAEEDMQQPFWWLWHILLSVPDPLHAKNALMKRHGISDKNPKGWTDEQCSAIVENTNFKDGFGSLSAAAMRKLIPLMKQGLTYPDACVALGVRHSNWETKEERDERKLLDIKELQHVKRGDLRNPGVEKVLNHLINLLKEIYATYGVPDDIRVELARELKQNGIQRAKDEKRMRDNETENKRITEELNSALGGRRPSRRDIEKYRIWNDFGRQSPYRPDEVISLARLFSPEYEIEHIIPRSRMLDDSRSNKVIAHYQDNKEKGDRTAYDFMSQSRSNLLGAYQIFIDKAMKERKINRAKYERLCWKEHEISNDFLSRDLVATQYIVKKAVSIMQPFCKEVWVSSGMITDYLKNTWGYDTLIEQIMLPVYKDAQLTEIREIPRKDNAPKQTERIMDWTKRSDHRHHALDAIVIACTTQADVLFINNLNQEYNHIKRDEGPNRAEGLREYGGAKRLIPQAIAPRVVDEKLRNMLISFKAGKRLATKSKQKIRGKRIGAETLVPRGELHQESVYGQIKDKWEMIPVKKLAQADLDLVLDNRLGKFMIDNNIATQFGNKDFKQFEYDGKIIKEVKCWKLEIVKKYNLDTTFTVKKVAKIVDEAVAKKVRDRLALYDDNPKLAFKDLEMHPLWFDEKQGICIKSVRCTTGATGAVEIRRGWVEPGSNYAVAIYRNENGILNEEVITFFEALQRKKAGLVPILPYHPEFGSLVVSMSENEMFVFDMERDALKSLIENQKYEEISINLYRVQTLSSRDFNFRKHLDTTVTKDTNAKQYKRINSLKGMTGIKVVVDTLGRMKLI
jgi:CRISPR-associated endonuclease Csn1